MKARRTLLIVIGIVVVGFIVLQLIPMGNFMPRLRFPGNPEVVQAITWDSPETEALLRRACLDCHSNETTWPWYSRIAPVSWLVYKDVNEAREGLNFSDLRMGRGASRLAEEIDHHIHSDMPPQIYTLMHPDAVLTDAEKQALVDGVRKTLAAGGANTTLDTTTQAVQPEGSEGGDGDSDND